MRFLIAGLGSIGKRHKENLKKLKQKVVIAHKNEGLSERIKEYNPDAVLICSPTSCHLTQALIAAKEKRHLFIEKPISHSLSGVDELIQLCKKNKLVLQVGYQMRFHPVIIKIKRAIESGKLGKIYSARIEAGQYLPDWRPNTNYTKSYSAFKKLGGGVVLDLSHEIDIAYWLFGKPKRIKSVCKKISDLKIETEALAEIIIEFENGVICEIHLDYLQKEYRRFYQIIGQKGNLYWQDSKNKNFDKNIPYLAEIENFIKSVEGKEKPLVNGYQAKEVLKIALAVKKNL